MIQEFKPCDVFLCNHTEISLDFVHRIRYQIFQPFDELFC